jgi:hypothetical protein
MPVMFVISGGIERQGSSNHSQEPRTLKIPPALTVILEEADAEFDDLVTIGVGARGFDIYDGGETFGPSSGGWYSA